MQDSRKNNVVALNPLGQGRGALGADAARILNECGEMAAAGFATALAKALERAAGELLELTDRVTEYDSRRVYGAAADFARDQRGAVETEFRRRFYQHFKRACRRDNARSAGQSELDAAELSLVAPDDLEESLAASTIENALNNHCGEELFGLAKRMGVLLDDPELQLGANPVGPETIGAAVMDTLKAQDLPVKAQLVLVPPINRFLSRHVREVYQGLNRYLVDADVLPTIRVGVRKAAPTPRPQDAPEKQAGVEAPAAVEEGQDIFNLLRQLMALGGMAGGGGIGGTVGGPPGFGGMPGMAATVLPGAAGGMAGMLTGQAGGAVVAAPVITSLTQLQRGQAKAVAAAGLDGARISDGQVNILREIRNSPVAGGMGQMDAMTLDIVAMVFDFILDDRRIPDAMKALIGRLQIPVLKVAMLDPAFFSQKTHPARRLLDALAEASMGWNEDEGHESELYRKVDELVQRILNQFDEDMDVFASGLEDFLGFLAEEKQRIDALTSRSAQLLRRREQGELGRIVAHNEVESHLFDQPMPEFIRAFLLGHWEQVLATHCARDGEGGETWNQALRSMDDLIWSVQPKTRQDDRKRLVALLPDLLKRLDEGFQVLDTPAEIRDQFFTGLVKCHAMAVRAGLRGAGDAPLPPEPAPIPAPAPAAALTGDEDFAEIPVLTEVVEVDPDLIQEIAAEPEERTVVEEIVIGDVGWLARGGDTPRQDEHDLQVQKIKRGTWIEYTQDDGSTVRAKLAWVSPLKGIYLFTNRLGQRAMSIQGAGLAAKFRQGQARIIDDVPLMERAVSNLLEKLQQKVS
ncbi:MAG: hypothetical protein FD187_847 [bacterium]|nr:MAG: hypothetical protein FD142_576 [bacterium]KAF0149890.1 MAG: hypothetical protein FD187_847 [bacterium]KAF0166352.1 MAG: hypothetical protein FD158_2636 [bacterium]